MLCEFLMFLKIETPIRKFGLSVDMVKFDITWEYSLQGAILWNWASQKMWYEFLLRDQEQVSKGQGKREQIGHGTCLHWKSK